MNPTTRKSNRYAWLPGLILATTGVAVLTFLLGLSMLEDRLIAQAGVDVQSAAAEIAEKLNLLLLERYGDIQVLAETFSRTGQDREEWTEYLNMFQRVYPLYFWLGVIDNNGRVLAATDRTTVGLDVGSKDWFRDLASKPALRVHDVQRDDLTKGRNVIAFSAPIRSDRLAHRTSTSFQGAVISRIDTSKLDAMVTRTLRELEVKAGYKQGLEYQILTRQGHVLAESIPEQNGPVDLFALGTTSAQLVFSGRTGFIAEEHRRRHVPVLTGYAQMPARKELDALGWGVLVRVDRQAILSPIRSVLWTATMWGGIFFTPMLGVLLWTTRQLRQEWHRAEAAKQALQQTKERAEQASREKAEILAAVEAFFIRVNSEGVVTEWTIRAEAIFGISLREALGQSFAKLPIQWSWEEILGAIGKVGDTLKFILLDKIRLVLPEGKEAFLKLTLSPIHDGCGGLTYIIMGENITERLSLERELAQAQKLESIGHLASGIAHEINTPTQFVGDNVRFLSDSFSDIGRLLEQYERLLAAAKTGTCPEALIETCEAANRGADLEYLLAEIPKAISQSAEGIDRVATIVRAIKEFAHPGSDEKICVDLNKAIESTVTVARNEWKYVADLHTNLDPSLPPVPCLVGEFNQVVLNMIINATHAVADAVKGTGGKGTITIGTSRVGDFVEVRIADTGMGIPESIRHKIFDPFFTTKEVGKGTGQGLAIARSVVVDKHGGTIAVDSAVGKGTTFLIRLPLNASSANSVKEGAS